MAVAELPEHLAKGLAPSQKRLAELWTSYPSWSQATQNYPGLCDEITRVIGKRCIRSHVLGQGSWNIVFLVVFEDNSDAVARLRCFPDIKDRPSTADMQSEFQSEVATLEFLAKNTSIVVPKVLVYDARLDNPLGTPYMVTTRVDGNSQGCELWHLTPPVQREQAARDLARVQVELIRAPFPAIGRLADANGTLEPLPPHDRIFHSSKSLLIAHVRAELASIGDRKTWRIQRAAYSERNGGVDAMPFGFAVAWFSLLLVAIADLPNSILDESDPPAFYLRHPDLDALNFLVDPSGSMTGVVDWQGAQVRPLWDWMTPNFILQPAPPLSQDENAHLLKIFTDIVRVQTGFDIAPSSSTFDRPGLLRLTSAGYSVTSSRQHLNKIFSHWIAGIEKSTVDCEAFLNMAAFVEVRSHCLPQLLSDHSVAGDQLETVSLA